MSDGLDRAEILAALPLKRRVGDELVAPLAMIPCLGDPLTTWRFPTAEEL